MENLIKLILKWIKLVVYLWDMIVVMEVLVYLCVGWFVFDCLKCYFLFNNIKELINFGVFEWINGINYFCGGNFCLFYKFLYVD